MLIEIKVREKRKNGDKYRKSVVTYLMEEEFFSEAESKLMTKFSAEMVDDEDYEILSLRQSQIKEVACQYTGGNNYIATLKDLWTDDDGNEKALKYKVLLWADSLTDATKNATELQKQGYNMLIESVREVNCIYLKI